MAIYGLTTDGFVAKTLEVIRNELATKVKDTFGVSVQSDSDESIIGQVVGIISEVAALVWELAEAINSSQDPDKAAGAALDALCTLTGTFRPQASYSTVTLTLTGTPASIVPEDSGAETSSTGVKFVLTEDATIAALSAWAGSTPYAVGDRVTNNSNAYECVTAGISDASGGPITTASTITESGGVEWTFLGEGTGAVDVIARATVTGPVAADARDISIISTQVSGWDGVINLLDATTGRNVASDEELRQIREAELAGTGNSTIDALRAALLDLEDVISVSIFVNNTDTTDADGLPPHSVEALVRPVNPVPSGFDQTVYDALLANVAAGIVTYGTWTPGTATDSQGTDHTMKYSRPTEVPIYVVVDVTVDPDEYPDDGEEQIQDAITLWGDAQATGKDAVAAALVARVFQVDGVLDATVKIGTAPSPTTSVTIPIALRELATYDSSRITVNTTNGTP